MIAPEGGGGGVLVSKATLEAQGGARPLIASQSKGFVPARLQLHILVYWVIYDSG